MRRPQMKPCQGRYNITAAIKAGSHHITSVGAQGHPHGRVFISTEEPSSALAAVSRWSMHSPRADGREVPQPSQVHVAMGSRLQRGSSGLGTAASPLHQTSSPPPVRNCLWLQHGERQRQSCNPPAPVPTTDRAWANIPAPSPPVGCWAQQDGNSPSGCHPCDTHWHCRRPLFFPGLEFLLKELLRIHAAQPPSLSVY